MSRVPEWTHIILHHSASLDSDGVDEVVFEKWHRDKGWQDIGYHWVVEGIDGAYQAVQGRTLAKEGSHQPGMNHRAIGICFAGNFEEHGMSLGMIEEGAKLIAGLCFSLKIPVENVTVHSDYKNTKCPGRYFPLKEIRSRAQQMIDQH